MISKDIIQIGVIATILITLAVLKIPSVIPGLDLQLPAPTALLILVFFGIKKYFLGGLLSNLLSLIFGVFNPINVITSIISGAIVIATAYLLKIDVLSLALADVLGSLVSRLILSVVLDLPVWVMLLNAIPGIVLTLVVAVPLYLILGKRMTVLLR